MDKPLDVLKQKTLLDILKNKKVNVWKLLWAISNDTILQHPLEEYNNGKKDKLTQEEYDTLKEWLTNDK